MLPLAAQGMKVRVGMETVELLRFLAVLQSPLPQFPSFGIHKGNLLEPFYQALVVCYHQSLSCLGADVVMKSLHSESVFRAF
jgi:hypothetical protein